MAALGKGDTVGPISAKPPTVAKGALSEFRGLNAHQPNAKKLSVTTNPLLRTLKLLSPLSSYACPPNDGSSSRNRR